MKAELYVTTPEGDEHRYVRALEPVQWPVVLGKGRACAVPMAGWKAAREHARLVLSNEAGDGGDGGERSLWLEDLGSLAGTWVNGQRVVRHGPIQFDDDIMLAGYRLRVKRVGAAASEASMAAAVALGTAAGTQQAQVGGAGPGGGEGAAGANGEGGGATAAVAAAVHRSDDPEHFAWRQRIHELLLETIDLRRRDLIRMSDAELRAETEALIREIVLQQDEHLPPHIERERLIVEVQNEAVGLGPLEDLLADASITEIMVNRFDEIFVERAGQLTRYPMSFTSDRTVLGVIERIVTPLGRRIDESSPMVDARLKDGSRVNAVIPPLALKGPTLTIRKFSVKKLQPQDLVIRGSISAAMVAFLRICVVYRKNVIVSGGTGSGKTTFLNVLSNFIPDGERIVTVEDAAELRLNHSHLISLEARPANAEGRGAVAIRDLVKNCLRMRPDRIVVGECRGGEALDMLQAMNTGHEGSLTTLHANSPRDALARLETMVLMSGMELPLQAIREQIASAVDIIVQQTRFPCGSRKIVSVAEVTGMEGGRIQLQELFRFERRGRNEQGKVIGEFKACDTRPSFYDDLREQGAELDVEIFSAQGTGVSQSVEMRQ